MTCRTVLLLGSIGVVVFALAASVASTPPLSSLSYPGHEDESDSDRLIEAYPALRGTRLDDCQTCHRGGEVTDRGGKTTALHPCSYCHLLVFPDSTVAGGAPGDFAATLNAFGRDYAAAGRSAAGLQTIGGTDSDGDGYANADELAALRYPGDADSRPGQATVPTVTISSRGLRAATPHEQFLLMNTHNQRFDDYAHYVGPTVFDLLTRAGVDLTGAEGVTFIAPDGFAQDFTLDEITATYPPARFHAALDTASFADPEQGFVTYPPAAHIPEGVQDGDPIPGTLRMMIAYERDGAPLDPSRLDPASGRLDGEGPFRLVVPQRRPGAPDRGAPYSPSGYADGHDYDDGNDHNTGRCVRGLVAIRIDPLPAGYEEFDWKNGGMALLERRELILYGHGVAGR